MASIQNILVPMDGSPLSKQALTIALEEYPNADVTMLHVINPAEPGYSYPVEVNIEDEPLHGSQEWFERAEELAEQLFSEVNEIAQEYETTVTTKQSIGEPGRTIIDYATHNDVDQIVIGSHGRDENERFLLGSVTETVVFRAPTRVLLVR